MQRRLPRKLVSASNAMPNPKLCLTLQVLLWVQVNAEPPSSPTNQEGATESTAHPIHVFAKS